MMGKRIETVCLFTFVFVFVFPLSKALHPEEERKYIPLGCWSLVTCCKTKNLNAEALNKI